jgi:hypothetical protein
MTTTNDSTSAQAGHTPVGDVELITESSLGINRQVFQKDDGRRLTIYRSTKIEGTS